MTVDVDLLKCLGLLLFLTSSGVNCQVPFGVLVAENVNDASKTREFCIVYNPKFAALPARREDAVKHSLSDWTKPEFNDLCSDPEPAPSANGSVVAVRRGNCTFSEKALRAQTFGSSGIIIISDSDNLMGLEANQSSDYDTINITVAGLGKSDFAEMKDMGEQITVQMYAQPKAPFPIFNVLLILSLAITTIVIGSYFSGLSRYEIWVEKTRPSLPGATVRSSGNKPEPVFTPVTVVVAVIMMIVMLLAMYFLYDYIVYVFIVLFALVSSRALYDGIDWLVHRLPPFATCRIPENNLPLLRTRPEVKQLVLMFVCLGIGVTWIVLRHYKYGFILQDILGVALCIEIMINARLSSLKVCVILLVLLFVYDIFFVFITPLFTKDGNSIMLDIATGTRGQSGEMIPAVLIVPKLFEKNPCGRAFSLLGFGDMVVPGLLVSFLHGFDLQVRSGRVYFISTSVAYGLGLITTFVASALMSQGQPALLYLVPFTLATTFIIGLKRGEVKQLWTGVPHVVTTTKPRLSKDPEKAPDNDSSECLLPAT